MTWEYKTEQLDTVTQQALNIMGKGGWELVAIHFGYPVTDGFTLCEGSSGNMKNCLVFKRSSK